MFAAVPTQLRGLSIVLWIVCFIGMYYAANELVEALKMKDHALRAAEREKQGDFYRIRTRQRKGTRRPFNAANVNISFFHFRAGALDVGRSLKYNRRRRLPCRQRVSTLYSIRLI